MPAARLTSRVLPSRRDVELLVNRVGVPQQDISGGNCIVWRANPHNGRTVVVRIAPPGVDENRILERMELARELHRAGVSIAQPTDGPIVRHGRLLGLVWEDLGPSGPRDYESFGDATASLHAVRSAAPGGRLAELLGTLPDADDVAGVRRTYEHAAGALLARHERAVLTPMVEQMEAFYASLNRNPRCVVHDDLWEKNVVFTPAGARLVDPDNLSWAFPDYDLAFVTRSLGQDGVTADDLRAFESGYGQPLPDKETADALALPHRLRWLLQCARDRAWKPQAAASFDYDLGRLPRS